MDCNDTNDTNETNETNDTNDTNDTIQTTETTALPTNEEFMQVAGKISCDNVTYGRGGPFGAVIIKSGTGDIVAGCGNTVVGTNDPTAHAEVNAIRQACATLKTHDLTGHTLYTSCEPCPMCLGAIYWAHIDRVYYSNTKADAARIGFDDQFIYEEMERPIDERRVPFQCIVCEDSRAGFMMWIDTDDKKEY